MIGPGGQLLVDRLAHSQVEHQPNQQQANGDYQNTQLGQSNQDTLRARIGTDFAQLTTEDVQIASAAGNDAGGVECAGVMIAATSLYSVLML